MGTKCAFFIDDLPSFDSFGKAVSEKIFFRNQPIRFQRRFFLEINQSETRIACGGHVCQRIGTK
jgi:hypothetical protein